MKLYIVTKAGELPRWVGTQAEAKALVREYGMGPGWEWQPYDVPTSKDDLLEFLNNCDVVRASTHSYVNAAIEEAIEERSPPAPTPQLVPTEAGRAKLRLGRECDDLVEYILEADGFVLSNLIGAVIERMQQLKRVLSAPAFAGEGDQAQLGGGASS